MPSGSLWGGKWKLLRSESVSGADRLAGSLPMGFDLICLSMRSEAGRCGGLARLRLVERIRACRLKAERPCAVPRVTNSEAQRSCMERRGAVRYGCARCLPLLLVKQEKTVFGLQNCRLKQGFLSKQANLDENGGAKYGRICDMFRYQSHGKASLWRDTNRLPRSPIAISSTPTFVSKQGVHTAKPYCRGRQNAVALAGNSLRI